MSSKILILLTHIAENMMNYCSPLNVDPRILDAFNDRILVCSEYMKKKGIKKV